MHKCSGTRDKEGRETEKTDEGVHDGRVEMNSCSWGPAVGRRGYSCTEDSRSLPLDSYTPAVTSIQTLVLIYASKVKGTVALAYRSSLCNTCALMLIDDSPAPNHEVNSTLR